MFLFVTSFIFGLIVEIDHVIYKKSEK